MLSQVKSCILFGLKGLVIGVEVDVSNGLPSFEIVGLPQTTVRESRERVRAAIRNAGFQFPVRRITVNLTPPELRKEGTHLDLPIALGILAANGQVDPSGLGRAVFIGPVSLDGSVVSMPGVLPMAVAVHAEGLGPLVLPAENVPEARLVEGLHTCGVTCLADAVGLLNKAQGDPSKMVASPSCVSDVRTSAFRQGKGETGSVPAYDMADVKGNSMARRALEIAAAGGHNLLLTGPPGTGKTLLAGCLPGILPSMTRQEALEVTMIHSVSGLVPGGGGLIKERPFRAPHHSISVSALIGGGSGRIYPGEVSLAHNGVLFLDEITECDRRTLESLRQPLEDREVKISRSSVMATLPAGFMLVAAANPCPCGYRGDHLKACTCTPAMLTRYQNRLSGPLLDRFDLSVSIYRDEQGFVLDESAREEDSSSVRERVEAARQRQIRRLEREGLFSNAQMNLSQIKRYCRMDRDARVELAQLQEKWGLSARAISRVSKVARTIADLGERDVIALSDIREAFMLRTKEKHSP